ncbi:MAG: hypothetical protein ACSHWZ_14540 [Sulfitobacter sp.]
MPFELFRKPIIPCNLAGLTTTELRQYLNVGRDALSPILLRFGITKLHGIVPEVVLWRQLFGLEPSDQAARDALREPLADVRWVSQATGVPMSTLRHHLRNERWQYDPGIQLGEETGSTAPRLRRWIPSLIRNQRLGSATPNFCVVAPLAPPSVGTGIDTASAREEADKQPLEDLFSLVHGGNPPLSQ